MLIPNLEQLDSPNWQDRASIIESVFGSNDLEQLTQLFSLFKDRPELEITFKEWFVESGLRIDQRLEEQKGNSVATLIAISNNSNLFSFFRDNGSLRMSALFDQTAGTRIIDDSGNNLLMLNLINLQTPIENSKDLIIARFLIGLGNNFRNPNHDGTYPQEICENIMSNLNHGAAFSDFYHSHVLPRKIEIRHNDDAMEIEEPRRPNPQFANPKIPDPSAEKQNGGRQHLMKTNFIIAAASFMLISLSAFASEKEFLIQIKDHQFQPKILEVLAGEKFKLVVENLDKTLEEFESSDLKKEKLVGAGKKITIIISPLRPGEYKFFGDFHQKTAQGKIIVK